MIVNILTLPADQMVCFPEPGLSGRRWLEKLRVEKNCCKESLREGEPDDSLKKFV